MNKAIIAFILMSFSFHQKLALCQNLSWILDCQGPRDYYVEIERLERSNIPRHIVAAELVKQLPHKPLGRCTECVYEIIISYADNAVVELFRKRAAEPQSFKNIDPYDYSSDIYKLLITKEMIYEDKQAFMQEILTLKHAVSYEHFLDMHLHELPIESRLSIMHDLLRDVLKTHATFPYYAVHRLKQIYRNHQKDYIGFIESREDLPYEFLCVMNNTCY